MELLKILRGSRDPSDWVRWLISDTGDSARPTLGFLERAFANVKSDKQGRIRTRLHSGDQFEVEAVLHELMVHEISRQLGLSPSWEPEADGLTPDLAFHIRGQAYIGDVFLTNRPESTRFIVPGGGGYTDAGQAAKKIADAVATKAHRYRRLDVPLLLFVLYAGRDVHSVDLEDALFGLTAYEAAKNGVSEQVHDRRRRHGVLCPLTADAATLGNLSAVMGCDWFATLNRSDPGRRLHLTAYHHWQPFAPLPQGTFAPFPEITWRTLEPGTFLPEQHGEANIVLRTAAEDVIDFRPYTADAPW